MVSRNDRGFSLIETIIGLGILTFIAVVLSRHFMLSAKAGQEIAARNLGQQRLQQLLQKVRRNLTIRHSAGGLEIAANYLRFEIPHSSAADSYYQLTIQTKCRPLPAGLSLGAIKLSDLGASCFQAKNCNGGLPFVEFSYLGQNSLPTESFPSQAEFNEEVKKKFSVPAFAVCFVENPTSLTIQGVSLQLSEDTSPKQRRVAFKSETIFMPINKRNSIEIVP